MDCYVIWRDRYMDEGLLGVSMDEQIAKQLASKYTDSSHEPKIEKHTVISESDIACKMYYLVVGQKDKYIFDKPKCYIIGKSEEELDYDGYGIEDLCKVDQYCVGKGEYATYFLEVLVQSDSYKDATDIAIKLFQEYNEMNSKA